MASLIHTEITEYLQSNAEADFATLESALLEAILDFHNIVGVKILRLKRFYK